MQLRRSRARADAPGRRRFHRRLPELIVTLGWNGQAGHHNGNLNADGLIQMTVLAELASWPSRYRQLSELPDPYRSRILPGVR